MDDETKTRVLAAAFGRRLVDGHGEWRGVAGVVRSALLLLHGELRRQDARHREERRELREELRVLREQLRLSSLDAPRKCECDCKRQLRKLRSHVDAQHEWSEVVVRAAEKQQRQLRALQKAATELVPRVRRVEKQVGRMRRALLQRPRRLVLCKEKEERGGGGEEGKEIGRKEVEREEEAIACVREAERTIMRSEQREDGVPDGRGERSPIQRHTSLRMRYQRERKRQLGRLERLRNAPLSSSSVSGEGYAVRRRNREASDGSRLSTSRSTTAA